MEKLIDELRRLYLPPNVLPDLLKQHLSGQAYMAVSLVTPDDIVRAIAIPFDKKGSGEDAQHWVRLCEVANVLQTELGLPMPAVSVSGTNGYRLWLSFADPLQKALAQRFLELLHTAYFPDITLPPGTVGAPNHVPPCLHPATGKWAAFIHPGMGASFADEAGLEMAPPLAGQVAFLEGLESITSEQFQQALEILEEAQNAAAPSTSANMPTGAAAVSSVAPAHDLLLKDATLEDIVKFLHSKNIEPTFRHLISR